MTKKRKRKIPKRIGDAVKQRHFFECAWCGKKLFEQHHIHEFSQGGEHSLDNLILLCPNDHTLVHKGKISSEELKNRKSTHVKGDRLTGDFKTTVSDLQIYLCGGIATNTPNLLSHNGYPILRIYKENHNILIDAKFYNKHGVLVLWMCQNMYWFHTNATISPPSIDFLEIKNANSSVYLKIEKSNKDNALNVVMTTYLAGQLIRFDEDLAKLSGSATIKGTIIRNSNGFINYQTKKNKHTTIHLRTTTAMHHCF